MIPLTIQQPAPCHESWEAMTPTEVGRHCAACATEVVDFARMSDEEVVAFVGRTTPGRRCGRFREDQVGRPLRAPSDSSWLVEGVVRTRWGFRKEGVWVRMGSFRDTTDARGHFRLLLPQSSLATIHFIALHYRDPRHDERHLTARAPFDPSRTKPYRITLKKAPVLRNPGFY